MLILVGFRKFDKSYKFRNAFIGLVVAGFIGDTTLYIMGMNRINNMIIMNSYVLVEGILFLLIYKKVFAPRSETLINTLLIAHIVLMIICLIFVNGFFAFPVIPRIFMAMVFTMLSLIWFIRLFRDMEIENLSEHPMFYVNAAALLYFAGTSFIFTFNNFFDNNDINNSLWQIHSILNITYNTLFGVALWKMRVRYR